jgi:DNA end-binding protein Ku
MAARAISTATISFGLVSIPVKLFPTADGGAGPGFHLLHRCGTRLKQQYFCPKDERVVPREEIVKGHEFARGQYVLFTKEELEALEEEASRLIEITEFVPLEKVDPLYYEKAYYLGPDKGGDKPYRLLSHAMRETGRCALARYAARGKQYLVLLRPFEDGLVMQQLRYADEIRSFAEVERAEASVGDAELALARQLVEQIAADEFHPERYEDAVKKRLEEVIAQKVEGEEVTFAPAAQPRAQVIDLMEALRASLEPGKAAGAPAGRKGPRRAAARPAAGAARKGSSRARGSRK